MKSWSGQKILIIGAARQGTALARYLATHGARVVLNDNREQVNFESARRALSGLAIDWVFGGHPLYLLDDIDMVCVSAGVPLTLPLIVIAKEQGILLSNDSQTFLELAPCPVIGITGSAGKTTTTSLVGSMAEKADLHRRVWIGGNIGSPLIEVVDEMTDGDIAVMELSSFQLELMTRSPHVAAILNVTPNHLDRHGTMEAYAAAKARILDFQNVCDAAVIGRDDPGAWKLRSQVRGELHTFGLVGTSSYPGAFIDDQYIVMRKDRSIIRIMSREDVSLRGGHNLQNVLAACSIGAVVSLPADAMCAAVREFKGVPHRLELVRSWGGADWYNDSIATAPERSMAAIRSFEEPLILLAGGRDKDLPWDDFADLVRQRVRHLILFGEAAGKIAQTMGDVDMAICKDLKEAVDRAAEVVQLGDVVLLSPGGTSFDEFRDFEERGECFRELVKQL
ncbi:MAG: UDP-N-acetylmuramoyl-L-alanine--D-glutamate ligase [Anaerolineales bacterium]